MNKERRKRLADAKGLLEQVLTTLEEIAQEEQDYVDNMPDSLRDGDKGQDAQSVADNLQQAHDDLENVVQMIDEAENV